MRSLDDDRYTEDNAESPASMQNLHFPVDLTWFKPARVVHWISKFLGWFVIQAVVGILYPCIEGNFFHSCSSCIFFPSVSVQTLSSFYELLAIIEQYMHL